VKGAGVGLLPLMLAFTPPRGSFVGSVPKEPLATRGLRLRAEPVEDSVDFVGSWFRSSSLEEDSIRFGELECLGEASGC